jgi:fibronectin-binding autotransporter adhesin
MVDPGSFSWSKNPMFMGLIMGSRLCIVMSPQAGIQTIPPSNKLKTPIFMSAKKLHFLSPSLGLNALRIGACSLALSTISHALTYTWLGGTGNWNAVNWDNGTSTVAGPTGSSNANTAIINSDRVNLQGNDIWGGGGTATSPVITVNNATLASAGTVNQFQFLTLNSGTFLANGGATAQYPAAYFGRTLTATGSSFVNVGTGSHNMINLGTSDANSSNVGKNLTIDTPVSTDSLTFNAVLQNYAQQSIGGTLTKSGAGTLTLNANNTYTGATLVSAGTLLVTGALSSSAVTVGSNGTIGGNGSLGRSLSFDAGAKLDLTGATIGLTSSNILTVAAGQSMTFSNFLFTDIVGWGWAAADVGTYTLINGGGTVTLSGDTPTIDNPFNFGNGKQGYFEQGSFRAVIEVIPEPSAALLGGLGMFFLLRRRRG